MPELPEVETTCRGITPHVAGHRIRHLTVHDGRLRWPVPAELPAALAGALVTHISRRGKYLLFHTATGIMMVHLGMSGSLRLVEPGTARKRHDHLVWALDSGWELRFHDPRRFGCCLWLTGALLDDPECHPLLAALGPEPLSEAFRDDHLFRQSRGKTTPVKSLLMDSHVVVGVGNIYANEALFRVGIHPLREAGRIGAARYQRLTGVIREILAQAIERGGTTLRDFVNGNGEPGYFQQELSVYGRAGQPCAQCGKALKEVRLNARSTVYCGHCQH